MPEPKQKPAQRLRVKSDIASLARRVQACAPGEYALLVTVDYDGRLTWRMAELGKMEAARDSVQ